MVSVSEISGVEGDNIQMHDLFLFEQSGVTQHVPEGAEETTPTLEAQPEWATPDEQTSDNLSPQPVWA